MIFYAVRRYPLQGYYIEGKLRAPVLWTRSDGVAWSVRGVWIVIVNTSRGWVWSCTSRMGMFSETRGPLCDLDILNLPVEDLPAQTHSVIDDWVTNWVTKVSPDRLGVDDVLHKIEDPVARDVAIKSYLENRL